MKKEILDDYRLLDVIAVISTKSESGRLQIDVGSTRGVLFFKEGQLVDARVGTLTGFAAVNLAVAGGASCLDFDSSIPPPPSHFTAADERAILKQRFGIETLDAETLSVQPMSVDWRRKPASSAQSVQKKIASAARSLHVLGTLSATYSRHKKTAVRSGAIVLIIIPTAVGLTSYWSKGKEPAGLEISPPREANALPTPTVVPSSTLSDGKSVTVQPITTAMTPQPKRSTPEAKPRIVSANPELAAPETPATDNVRPISGETLAGGLPEKKESDLPEGKGVGPVEEKQSAKSAPRRIAVIIRVEDGRVSEAYVLNRRPGLEGYEATALRLARQRRYPKETSTTETVVFQVNDQN